MSVGTQRRLRGEKKERRKVRWNKANGRNGKVSFFNLALWTGFEPRKSKRVDSKDKTPFQQKLWSCKHKLCYTGTWRQSLVQSWGWGRWLQFSLTPLSTWRPLLWQHRRQHSWHGCCPSRGPNPGQWWGSTLGWVERDGLPKKAVGQQYSLLEHMSCSTQGLPDILKGTLRRAGGLCE